MGRNGKPKRTNEDLVAEYQISGNQKVLEQIVRQNEGLVGMVIKRFRGKYISNNDLDDLLNAGRIAIIKAARTFDATKGFKFSTYASMCIHRKMQFHLKLNKNNLIHIPISAQNEGVKCPSSISIEKLFKNEEDNRTTGLPLCLDDPVDNAIEKEEKQKQFQIWNKILNRLREREQDVIRLRMAGWTLNRIGKRLGVTKERVRQIETEAIQKLRMYYEDTRI